MRLLCTFNNDREGRIFSVFLAQEEIENQLDLSANKDWGSPEYGNVLVRLWVIDEDDIETADQWLKLFLKNPNDPQFVQLKPQPPPSPPITESQAKEKPEKQGFFRMSPSNLRRGAIGGILTIYLILACTILFFLSQATSPPYEPSPISLPPTPLFSSPIKKAFFYDYPRAFELIDKIIQAYGMNKLYNPSQLPPEGHYFLKEFYLTSYWQGIYPKIVNYLKKTQYPHDI